MSTVRVNKRSDKMEFSALIRKKRSEKGLTVRELEKKIAREQGAKVSKTLINFIEKGKRQPTYEVAYALARALDIDVEQSLSAAYQSRCIHNEAREAVLIKDLLRKRESGTVAIDTILRRREKP